MGIGFTHAELIDEDTFGTIDEAEFFDFAESADTLTISKELSERRESREVFSLSEEDSRRSLYLRFAVILSLLSGSSLPMLSCVCCQFAT